MFTQFDFQLPLAAAGDGRPGVAGARRPPAGDVRAARGQPDPAQLEVLALQRGVGGAGGVVQRVRVVRQRLRPGADHAALGRAALLARGDAPRGVELPARAVHDDGHPHEPRAAARRGARRGRRRRRRQDRTLVTRPGSLNPSLLLFVIRVTRTIVSAS